MEKKPLLSAIGKQSARLRPAPVPHLPRLIQHLAVKADTLKPPGKYRTHRSQLVREDPIANNGTDARGAREELDRRIHMLGLNSI